MSRGSRKSKKERLLLRRSCPCGEAIITFDDSYCGSCPSCEASYVLDPETGELMNAEECADVCQQMNSQGDGEAFRELVRRSEFTDSADAINFRREKIGIQDDYSGIIISD